MHEAVVLPDPIPHCAEALSPCAALGAERPQPSAGRRASSPRITQHKSFLSPPQGPFITGPTPCHAWLDRGILLSCCNGCYMLIVEQREGSHSIRDLEIAEGLKPWPRRLGWHGENRGRYSHCCKSVLTSTELSPSAPPGSGLCFLTLLSLARVNVRIQTRISTCAHVCSQTCGCIQM